MLKEKLERKLIYVAILINRDNKIKMNNSLLHSINKNIDTKKSKGVILMAICPLCNSLKILEVDCPKCHKPLEDFGKVADYQDPYSHYNDEDTVKMGDGYPNSAKEQLCPHLMVCKSCDHEEVRLVKEE